MKSLNILLVEDNLPLAKSTAKLIERLSKHQVQLTDDPKTFFEQCTTSQVDIVLMDINLPGASWEGKEVSGIDLSRLLKAQAKTTHIPVILLTAYMMPKERESLLANSQADEFFTKPISDYKVLIKVMEQLAEDSRRD